MAISFTSSVDRSVGAGDCRYTENVTTQKKKRQQQLAKIKQIQRDQKLSQSASDLSSKISRETKLKKEVEAIDVLLAQAAKQLAEKQQRLAQQRLKLGESPSREK